MSDFIIYQFRYALPIWFFLTITSLFPDNRYSIKIRGYLVSLFLPNRPKNFTLGRDVTLLGVDKLFLGDNVYIAKGCWINALGKVVIGSEVMLAPYVIVASTKHTFYKGSVFKGSSEFKAVYIGSGSWIAGHATITSGAYIGKGCLVAANSVAINSYADESLIAGVPGRVVKDLKE